MAAFTLEKRFAFFYPGHRDEKYLKIMIDALVIGLVQSANGTAPGIFIKHLRFGGYAEDKEHSFRSGFRVQRFTGAPEAHKPPAAPEATRVQGFRIRCNLYYNP